MVIVGTSTFGMAIVHTSGENTYSEKSCLANVSTSEVRLWRSRNAQVISCQPVPLTVFHIACSTELVPDSR